MSTQAEPRTTEDTRSDDAPILIVEALTTTFTAAGQHVEALRGVDLSVSTGEINVLLGESGSGKSVTARSILRLYGPSASLTGSVHFDGHNLLELDEKAMEPIRGSGIALVPQDPTGSLDPLRKVGAQIVEVLRLHGMVGSKSEGRERARELLRVVGLPDPDRMIDAFPHELSGGMKQRVAIAIAVSCEPKLLIADEPTTALDVTVQAQILELFLELTTSLGSAMLLVTHDVGVAKDVADHVSVMYAGRIVEEGAAASVLERPVHPYTRALLDAVPTPDVPRGGLNPILGQPPVSGVTLPGCAFAPRCPSAATTCTTELPELEPTAAGHQAACPVVVGSGAPT